MLTTYHSLLTKYYFYFLLLSTYYSLLTTRHSLQGDDFEHQSLDEKLDTLKLQTQSSRDTYSPGGSLANLGIEIIAQADSRSSRRAKLEDAHYPGLHGVPLRCRGAHSHAVTPRLRHLF